MVVKERRKKHSQIKKAPAQNQNQNYYGGGINHSTPAQSTPLQPQIVKKQIDPLVKM
jgi:hypothetical protein